VRFEKVIQLKNKDLDQIRQIAVQTYPHECCGVMAGLIENGTRMVTEVIPAENQRTDSPANRYLITADFLFQVERRLRANGQSVIGFFHSHPDVAARPSSYDLEHAWPWYSYLIVSVREGQVDEVHNWRLKDDRSSFDPEEVEIL
jgi:proteasome lid subunit RPN8/RPN11